MERNSLIKQVQPRTVMQFMKTAVYLVDAFTDRPFSGNPAAVCVMPRPRDDAWMQDIAREMNQSETAFVHHETESYYRLRWFTPVAEIELCGHATLASAHILWEAAYVRPGEKVVFETLSGALTAKRHDHSIALDFPAEPAAEVMAPLDLRKALGLKPSFIGRNRMDYLVEVESEDVLRALKPDYAAIRNIDARGIIVTARSASSDYDFVSRFFAPAVGIDEDPVTGSAHCCLGPYWQAKLGKNDLVGYQASARGGVVRVRLDGSRALLTGQCVTMYRGEVAI